MKQKIVMKVDMICDKCRTKALKFAAVANGVESVAIAGAEKDQVVVIGESVDSVSLAKLLTKKVGHTRFISIEKVKPKPKEDEPKPILCYPPPPPYHPMYDHMGGYESPKPILCYPPPPPYYPMYDHMGCYESPNPTGCSIM